MKRITFILCLILAACGGGGEERPEIKASHDPQVVLPVSAVTGATGQ